MNVVKNVSLVATTALLGLLGCNSDSGTTGPEAGTVVLNPTFEEGQGQQAPAVEQDYAPGPYGFEVGRIAPNMQWIGYANFVNNQNNPDMQGLQVVNLSDFYNPTDDGVFPEGSPYGAGTPKPKALVLVMSSVWCGPCNLEADEDIPIHMAEYSPQGGYFLSVLIDSSTPGDPADVRDLTRWAEDYEVNYTLVLDPAAQVTPLYEPAFPGNLIIDTTNMSIVERVAGIPNASFWATFEGVLNGTN